MYRHKIYYANQPHSQKMVMVIVYLTIKKYTVMYPVVYLKGL